MNTQIKKSQVSLFVSTYNMPRHLELVCAGLEIQSFENFEVFFCDDGSGPETREVINQFKVRFENNSSRRAHHVWQENKGFRKCKILNEAVRRARGDIFVFLDGDCIPHRHYIFDHWNSQESGFYLAGRRVELGRKISESLEAKAVRSGYFDFPKPSLIWSAIRKDTEFLNRSIRVPWKSLRTLLKMNRVVDLKGCNYSIPRAALEAINGFDESYEGYGREDTDVEIRLQNLGLKIKSLKGIALQFHVWHPRREFTPANDSKLEEVKRLGIIQCKNGLNIKM